MRHVETLAERSSPSRCAESLAGADEDAACDAGTGRWTDWVRWVWVECGGAECGWTEWLRCSGHAGARPRRARRSGGAHPRHAARLGVASLHPADRHQRLADIAERRHVGPQVELLEHHRQICANADDLIFVGGTAVVAGPFPDDWFPVEQDIAALAVFQQVCAAQQC